MEKLTEDRRDVIAYRSDLNRQLEAFFFEQKTLRDLPTAPIVHVAAIVSVRINVSLLQSGAYCRPDSTSSQTGALYGSSPPQTRARGP